VIARWCAVLLLTACGSPAIPPEKFARSNETGAAVDVDRITVAGYVTIVDFWSESCGACVVVGGMTAVAIAKQRGIVLRKIDVGDGFTAVAKQYAIGALPHYRVYDKQRRLRYDLVGNDCLQASAYATQLLREP
jgi:thiol-disulfide isomerase/thioredoxin